MGDYFKPLTRLTSALAAPAPIVTYDFETTRIPTDPADPMTVYPLYLTAYAGDWSHAWKLGGSYEATADAFTELWRNVRPRTLLCAYNANRFDLRIFLQSLLQTPFVVEPFAARVSGLRGAIVRRGKKRVQMLDPIAMLGLACDLRTFLETFAPQYPKGTIDFEKTAFDADDPAHQAYAMRDSEALWHALHTAQTLVEELGGERLRATVGSLAIRSFMRNLPEGVVVPHLRPEVYRITRQVVMRGGYVYAHKYQGPLWTYDLNQAYAHAMRACDLPAGRALPSKTWDRTKPSICSVELRRDPPAPIPYVVRVATAKPGDVRMEARALRDFEAESLDTRFDGLRVKPSWVWERKRWRLAGEYVDVPKRFLDRSNRPSRAPFQTPRLDGNADQIAYDLGMTEDELLEALCTRPERPKLTAYEREARRRVDETLAGDPWKGEWRATEIDGSVPVRTWITGDEVHALRALGWTVTIDRTYAWESAFRMTRFVDDLEAKRRTYEKSDPRHIICKAIGCNAYGKTLQEPQAMRVVLARDPPEGGFPLVSADADGTPLYGFWMVPEVSDTRRRFMRPQLGSFITAYIRTVVYGAAMADAAHFVKADTDSVSFTRPQPHLALSSWQYGAWKCESAGDFHIVVGKKVSWSQTKTTAKGMRTRALNRGDFDRWYEGEAPVQQQIQLQSWRKGSLAPTWRPQTRTGTRTGGPHRA